MLLLLLLVAVAGVGATQSDAGLRDRRGVMTGSNGQPMGVDSTGRLKVAPVAKVVGVAKWGTLSSGSTDTTTGSITTGAVSSAFDATSFSKCLMYGIVSGGSFPAVKLQVSGYGLTGNTWYTLDTNIVLDTTYDTFAVTFDCPGHFYRLKIMSGCDGAICSATLIGEGV